MSVNLISQNFFVESIFFFSPFVSVSKVMKPHKISKLNSKNLWGFFWHSVISDPDLCPVNTFKFYMSKLNKSTNFLWQKPKKGRLHYTDEEWFEQNRVGKDLLNRFMKFLQQSVTLENKYTNHSIRAMVISKLDADGFEARHIMKLSSHKNESTIKEYAVECPHNKRKEMFDSLSNAMQPKYKKIRPKQTAMSTMSVPPNNKQDEKNDLENTKQDQNTLQQVPDIIDVKENLPNFNLQPLDNFDTIDDTVLQDLLSDDFSDTPNTIQNYVPPPNPKTPQKTINTQVNTFNIPPSCKTYNVFQPCTFLIRQWPSTIISPNKCKRLTSCTCSIPQDTC